MSIGSASASDAAEALVVSWRSSGVQALPLGLEPAALAAEVVGGLEEGDAVTGVAEQHGRGQPPDPPADDDDAAHGYSPKNSATVSCTPATAPAT